ncbi:hypothetical protein [Paenibacillus daejeonensis]|uniref:hypothetical protein n=1 Tax=Paenibacillus daejeonensis TaxID=135193 RepID=UPI0003779DB9|nr:hypothetical protein [Paenibacillus daejeonensis]
MILDALSNLVLRKMTAAYFATLMLSVALAAVWHIDVHSYSNGIIYVLSSTLVFGMYAGVGCLFYGTPISLCIEAAERWLSKRIRLGIELGQNDTPDAGASHKVVRLAGSIFYVALHGVFGLVPGLLFMIPLFVWCGAVTAVLYALGDRWARYRLAKNQSIKRIWLLPLASALVVSIWIDWFMF